MADIEMDDMDIDLALDDPEIARLHAETAAMDAQANLERAKETDSSAMAGVEEAPEDGEVDNTELAPTKVYVRGLDHFNPKDLNTYVAENGVSDLFNSIQWIDDTSANLVYDTERAAEDALLALSAVDEIDHKQLRAAKRLSTHPDTELEVRLATISDVKVSRASLYSRFYLDNPEYDPETRAQQRKRRRDHDGRRGRGDGYKRPRSDRWEYRDPSPNATPFDENLYDDAPADTKHDRRPTEDLFASKQNDRLRGRSASPTRDGDGRYGFAEDQPQRKQARYRSRTPPNARSRREANRDVQNHLRKELFPDKTNAGSSAPSNGNGSTDLFAPRNTTPKPTKELFPEKLTPTHRRREARDLHPNEVASAIGKFRIHERDGTHAYDGSGRRPENTDRRVRTEDQDLFPHLPNAAKSTKEYGRLTDAPDSDGFSFRGQNGSAGFNILGASRGREENPVVKELFPNRAPANGRDLFDGKIKGRANRRRAEDLM